MITAVSSGVTGVMFCCSTFILQIADMEKEQHLSEWDVEDEEHGNV